MYWGSKAAQQGLGVFVQHALSPEFHLQYYLMPGVVAHISNPDTWEVENQEFRVIFNYVPNLGQPGLLRSCLKTQTKPDEGMERWFNS